MITQAHVSDKSMNHITMARGHWRMYVCRYAEWYQCACDFVICENCYNKHNSTRSRQNNNVNAQRLQDMFNLLFYKHTGEARCVENPLEYHKLQYLNISDSAHIWIPSWHNKKWKELQNQKKRGKGEIYFPSDCCKNCKKKGHSRSKIKYL